MNKFSYLLWRLLFTIVTSSGMAQNVTDAEFERLKHKASQLEAEIKTKTDSLILLQKEIDKLENQKIISKYTDINGGAILTAATLSSGSIRREGDPFAKIIAVTEKGDTVKLLDYQNPYWIVIKGDRTGYLSERFIFENDDVKRFKNVLQERNRESIRKSEFDKIARIHRDEEQKKAVVELETEEMIKALTQDEAQRRKKVLGKYGKTIGHKLLDGYYWLGMTAEMASVSLGEPGEINKTVGGWGIHEQWIYDNLYLYFENGRLASYQNSK